MAIIGIIIALGALAGKVNPA